MVMVVLSAQSKVVILLTFILYKQGLVPASQVLSQLAIPGESLAIIATTLGIVMWCYGYQAPLLSMIQSSSVLWSVGL